MKDIIGAIKKYFALEAAAVLSAVIIAAAGIFGGCSNKKIPLSDDGYFVVTFVQQGEKDMVFKVKNGEALTEIPAPKEVAGYFVVWEEKDFTEITENMTVSAIYTPKSYTVYYDMGILEGVAEISSRTQVAVYNEKITLLIPVDKSDTYIFTGYVVKDTDKAFGDGIYTYSADIILVAQWKRVWSGDYS